MEQRLTRIATRVHFEQVPTGGVRVAWPQDLDAEILALTGGRVRSGDVITDVDGYAVRSRFDLWTAYRLRRKASIIRIIVRRSSGALSFDLRNPLQR
jgi:hypothetical protein